MSTLDTVPYAGIKETGTRNRQVGEFPALRSRDPYVVERREWQLDYVLLTEAELATLLSVVAAPTTLTVDAVVTPVWFPEAKLAFQRSGVTYNGSLLARELI